MQVKLLHDLVEEMAGESTGRIVEILFKKKDVNEFLIAKKMELTINQVRNILYKLSADNLVSFIRKKDKRKGWYIYYWTLNSEKCLAKLESSLAKKIENFEEILRARETGRFYICTGCDIEVGEEKALENGFSCEECAEIYELKDNLKPIRIIKAKITKVKKDLELIEDELAEVRKKTEVAIKKASNKIDKEKKKKSDLLKVAKAAARKKVAKEVVKKVAKKTVKKVVKKAVKKVAKKTVKKVAKKVAKKVSLASKLKNRFSRK